MSAQDLVAAIKSATSDAPAIIRLEIWPEGVGNAPPPQEILVKLYPADAPVIIPIPPVVPVTMFVVSTNGVFLHNKTDTFTSSRIVVSTSPLAYATLPFGKDVKVNPDPTSAAGYIWRIIAAGEPNAGLFVAEKSVDGTTVILSVNRP